MARTEAKRLLGLIASGEDPAEHPTSGRGLRDRWYRKRARRMGKQHSL